MLPLVKGAPPAQQPANKAPGQPAANKAPGAPGSKLPPASKPTQPAGVPNSTPVEKALGAPVNKAPGAPANKAPGQPPVNKAPGAPANKQPVNKAPQPPPPANRAPGAPPTVTPVRQTSAEVSARTEIVRESSTEETNRSNHDNDWLAGTNIAITEKVRGGIKTGVLAY